MWLWALWIGCVSEPGDRDKANERDDSDVIVETDTLPHDSDSDTESDTEVAGPACELGTGVTAFEPFESGQPLPIYYGPQGGWHVYGGLRCTGIVAGDDNDPRDPTNPRVSWVVEYEGEVIGGYEDLPRPMNRDGQAELIGELLILLTPTCEENLGRHVTVRYTLTDATGEVLTESREAVLAPQPELPADTDG